MRHIVVIKRHKMESGSTGYNDFGQLSVSSTAWTAGVVRRASIEQLSGNEAVLARQLYPYASHRVTIDYDESLASTGGNRQAVFFGGRMLFIGSIVNQDLENLQLELLCGEER